MAKPRSKNLFMDTWLLELTALAVCVASLGTILVLLACYDNRPNFHWHKITLNALISIFATLVRNMLAIVVSSALGQFKWIWYFRASKPLPDFSLIDDASRGSWGGLRLLIKTKSLLVACTSSESGFLELGLIFVPDSLSRLVVG